MSNNWLLYYLRQIYGTCAPVFIIYLIPRARLAPTLDRSDGQVGSFFFFAPQMVPDCAWQLALAAPRWSRIVYFYSHWYASIILNYQKKKSTVFFSFFFFAQAIVAGAGHHFGMGPHPVIAAWETWGAHIGWEGLPRRVHRSNNSHTVHTQQTNQVAYARLSVHRRRIYIEKLTSRSLNYCNTVRLLFTPHSSSNRSNRYSPSIYRFVGFLTHTTQSGATPKRHTIPIPQIFIFRRWFIDDIFRLATI